jgi:hypothetical protein
MAAKKPQRNFVKVVLKSRKPAAGAHNPLTVEPRKMPVAEPTAARRSFTTLTLSGTRR